MKSPAVAMDCIKVGSPVSALSPKGRLGTLCVRSCARGCVGGGWRWAGSLRFWGSSNGGASDVGGPMIGGFGGVERSSVRLEICFSACSAAPSLPFVVHQLCFP